MSDGSDRHLRSLRSFLCICTLYVLSIGPVYGLVLRGHLPPRAARVIYAPIWVLTARVGALDDLIWRWIDVFAPEMILHDFGP